MTTHEAAGGNGSTRVTIRATLERVLPPATMLTVGVGAVLTPTADAATFTVTNLNDAGAGSLRQALTDANGAAGADIVAFQAGLTGTITLTTGQLDITDAVDVQGPGAASITVSGNNASRVFYLYTDGNFAATISGLTVTGGAASSGAGIVNFGQSLTLNGVVVQGNAASNAGGGVLTVNGGDLTINNCTISGNTATSRAGGIGVYNGFISVADSVISGNSAQGSGGGLYLYGVDGNVTIARTTISGNTSIGLPRSDAPFGQNSAGAGVFAFNTAGDTLIDRSTISGNTAVDACGGVCTIANGGAFAVENSTLANNTAGVAGALASVFDYGSSELRHVTISGNTAGQVGGGLLAYYATLALDHALVANNTAGQTANDTYAGSGGVFNGTFSLVEAPGAPLGGSNNITGTDPNLGALGNNGGPTQTILPIAPSAAIDAGDPAFVPPPAIEQRGLPRVANARIDIGSVELQPQGSPGQLDVDSVTVNEGAGTATLTVTRSGGSGGAIGVSFTTADGSATAPDDYTTTAGTLAWPDGDATPRSIVVPIINDTVPEPTEVFLVSLSAPTGGATIGTGTGTITIIDNDIRPVPTGGRTAQGLLAGLLALLGLRWLRRRRELAALVAAAGLSLVLTPAPARAVEREVIDGRLAAVEHAGSVVRVRLASGQVVDIDQADLWFVDRRWRAASPATSLDALPLDTPLRIRVLRAANGTVREVRVVAIEPRGTR